MKNPSVGNVFAQRLRETRELRGLTRNELADLVSGVGIPMSSQVIKKIEQGGERASNVSITELFAFGAALNVGPAHLLTLNDDEALMAVPTRPEIRSDNVRVWIRGFVPLDDREWGEFLRAWPATELRRGLGKSSRPGIDVKRTPSPSGALEGGFFKPDDVDDHGLDEADVDNLAWEVTYGEQSRLTKEPTEEMRFAQERDPEEEDTDGK